jgi:hypothetical protein
MAKFVQTIPNTSMEQRMARGHKLRFGHEQKALHVSDDGVLWHKVRTCCGEQIPETVKTFDDFVPDKPVVI